MNDDIKNTILQVKNIEYLRNKLGKEQWIQVTGHKDINGADAAFWCGLVSINQIDELFFNYNWEISSNDQSCPGFEGTESNYQYKTNLLNEGFESLVYYRDFYGVKPDYIELSQEFILLNNLYFDHISNSYWAMYDNGESEEAVKYIDNTTIFIKMKFIRQYSSAKQMAIVIFFDIRTLFERKQFDVEIEDFYTEYKNNDLYYGLWGGNLDSNGNPYSTLMGKKIIMPLPVEKCGYWPFLKEKNYTDFVIGVDEFGNEIQYTCNPDKLSNYFGANPGAPFYLTPVFFKREVLQKYYNKPELYTIKDGYLSCKNLWGIEIDNHYKKCISVYLGDLGRDLPESELSYWKSFNVIGEDNLSSVSIQRDFLSIPAESNMVDHQFQYLYSDVSKKWEEKYGWELFLHLSDSDQYNYSCIRIPITDSQIEFDQLVLSLVKVLIDSLNEKKINIEISNEKKIKGISKLEKWLEANGAVDFDIHIQFLRDLQELRSSGTGHRKGRSYEKISRKFGLNEKSRTEVFEEILQSANAFLTYLKDTFL